jgi:DNA polymerase-4
VPRVIFHIDMDAFFASVEQRDNPSLRGRPVIVGSPPDKRGVVCAASYEARKFGVRSAMPSRTAHRLCPAGVFIRPRMDAYRTESHAIMELLTRFGGAVEQVSVDEAYLDMSHRFEGFDTEAVMGLGREMKDLIRSERRLTASIGIGANKLLAKIASDHGKPDGLFCITEEEKVAFLRPLPASAIHGVGKVTAETLTKAGLRTIGDLQDYRGELRALAGSYAPILRRYAMGEDDRALEYDGEVKSVSAEDDEIIVDPRRNPGTRFLVCRLGRKRKPSTLHLDLHPPVWRACWFPQASLCQPIAGVTSRMLRNSPLHFLCTLRVQV